MSPAPTEATLTAARAAADAQFATFVSELDTIDHQWDWGEDEIAAAQQRHPDHADELYHSFHLLPTSHRFLQSETLYRAHCRELLERVAAGRDTRPGTAAEVLITCHLASVAEPVNTAAGLYFRMWHAVGLPDPDPHSYATAREHYEASTGSRIDEAEADARDKLTEDQRLPLLDIECNGRHLTVPTPCRYAAPAPEQADYAP
ncbi:hypothetical protein [Nocardia sp. NBC_00511]|uniref:hypothetical protein n=1 Tax=Nocardia sp. NBC_00511 TaxID=2903591 RepID=UPI002F915A2B